MKKLKIIQLESFYQSYINDIYQNNEWLKNVSFQEQINFLLNTGFSAGQNFVPFLNPHHWDSHYIILNNIWTQVQWANENKINNVKSLSEILLFQINNIEPDVLFISDIPGFDFSLISKFKRRPLIVAWLATVVNNNLPWHEVDVILSGISEVRNTIINLGAKAAEKFMSAAPYHLSSNKLQQKKGNIVFAGSFFSGIHDQRAHQIDRLSHFIKNCNIDIYTANKFDLSAGSKINFFPAVYGNELVDTYSNYNIVLDARGNFNLSNETNLVETANMRIFEATRAGSLLITENSPNLPEYFNINEEIITYNNFEELKDKIAYYNHPDNAEDRENIAQKGRLRSIKDHSIESRANLLEKILYKYLDIKDQYSFSNIKISKENHYCTYFDVNYLPRGIAMIRSLHRNDPFAKIYVLCLDEMTYEILSNSQENITLINIKDLLASDIDLKLSQKNRTQIEWYFTITPCIIKFIIENNSNIHNLFYIDSDLYFYNNTLDLIEECENASAQVIEHRFPPQLQHLLVYGKYNVGWVGFSNNAEGLKLIDEYRSLCLEWCYDRIEEHRYGDQKYLDLWPQKYLNCVVSKKKGANVAQWNIPGRLLTKSDGVFFIDEDPLIFYHFHGVARLKSGNYVIKGDPSYVGNYFDLLYEPYFTELREIEKEFNFPSKNITAKDIRFNSW